MNEPTEPIDHIIRRTLADTVGTGPAWLVDLDDVHRIDPSTLGVGDPNQDGCVTVTADDRVTVWRAGIDAATARLAGAYLHFASKMLDGGSLTWSPPRIDPTD